MMPTDISIVCFDLGGVILRHHRSWKDGCQAAGLDVRGESSSPASREKRSPITRLYMVGQITHEDFINQTSEALNGLYSPNEIHRIHHAWLMPEYPGVEAVIDRLHKSGIRTACLSNTNEGHWRRMLNGEYPTVGALQHHFASHILGCAKPDEAIYHAFEEQVNCAGPQILFFDDLDENIQAARAMKWNAHHIDHAQPTAPQIQAVLRAHDLLTAAR